MTERLSTVQDLAKAIIDHLGTDPSKYERGWLAILAIAAEVNKTDREQEQPND